MYLVNIRFQRDNDLPSAYPPGGKGDGRRGRGLTRGGQVRTAGAEQRGVLAVIARGGLARRGGGTAREAAVRAPVGAHVTSPVAAFRGALQYRLVQGQDYRVRTNTQASRQTEYNQLGRDTSRKQITDRFNRSANSLNHTLQSNSIFGFMILNGVFISFLIEK